MTTFPIKRLGFFTRLLDQVDAAERYRLATQQIVQAEKCGFDSAWIAQHHFHEGEGGLPAPFVFLAHAAAHTSRIRLGTGIVTLPLELPIRVAADAAVTDLMSEGRLEGGVGPGGTLVDRIWQATFPVSGARRAGLAGDGQMLSRTQPRSPEAPQASLADIQNPMLDAYLEALPKGVEPRILASRTIFVADDHNEAMRLAEIGLSRMRHRLAATGNFASGSLVGDLIRAMDVHIGTPDEVIASLQADSTLQRSTDLTMQVHSIDPPHPYILRSIELFAGKVAPALGWVPEVKAGARQVA